jgi:acyl-ACP thioesterase
VDCFRRLRLSVLMRLFQECCIAHTEELGMGREKTLDRGFLWVINSETIEITRLPEYDEEITLLCRPGRTLHFFFPRQMAVLDHEGNVIIRIGAIWSLIGMKTRELIDPGEEGITISGEDRADDVKAPVSLRDPALPRTTGKRTAAYSQIDINGHMNNTNYVDMALDLIGYEELKDLRFTAIRCLFRKEILPGTEFDLRWGKDGNTWLFRNEYFAIDLVF